MYKLIAFSYLDEYSHSERALDVCVLLFLMLTDLSRILFARKGKKCCEVYALFVALVLCFPVVLAHCFFYIWQTIVFELDIVINIISIIFIIIIIIIIIIITNNSITIIIIIIVIIIIIHSLYGARGLAIPIRSQFYHNYVTVQDSSGYYNCSFRNCEGRFTGNM